MSDLLRREFLIKVLMTIGIHKLVAFTGLKENQVLDMSTGCTAISDLAIECVYQALAGCA